MDLIDRAELKKTAKRIASMPWCDEDGNRVEFEWSLKELEQLIDKAPSAEPKKGRWIDEGWYADGHDHHVYCCSKCGEHYIKCPYEIIKFKYCPNCGASMEMTE